MNRNDLAHLLELFQLNKDFTQDDLKTAYRDLVQVWHPDKFTQNERLKERAEKKIIEINEANVVLRDYLASKSQSAKLRSNSSDQPKVKIGTFLKTIFHPTDFSITSDVAFSHALKIALVNNAKLSLMHVSHKSREDVMDEFPKIRESLKVWGVINENHSENDMMKLGFRYQ